MAITQDILTVYSALAEHIYRRDSTLDQALNIEDIAGVLGLNTLLVPTKDNRLNRDSILFRRDCPPRPTGALPLCAHGMKRRGYVPDPFPGAGFPGPSAAGWAIKK